MSYFFSRIKRVKPADILAVWKLLVTLIPAIIYRKTHPKFWVISEAPNEARDNGFWFFKYMRTEHPEQPCFYAINPTSFDYDKVAQYGNTVAYGSLRHWVLYLAADKIISSQKASGPNAAIFGFLEVYRILKTKKVYLQHGVIINDLKWLYFDVTRIDKFICGAYPEYNFVRDRFGYPQNAVLYTGLCRFDGLHEGTVPSSKMVLVMPTFREWIADEDSRMVEFEGTKDFTKTEYFSKWTEFINSERIKELSLKYDVHFVFFPHREMQKYLSYFPKSNESITIAGGEDWDIQELLKSASMMVTDYSSVFMDMIYMKKPVVFYQFDYDKFRAGQYGEGYFDYRNNSFGKSFQSPEEVFDIIEDYLKIDFAVSKEYLEAHKEFFPLYDDHNCERIYDAITERG